jgi:hypothetical protein
VQSFAVTLYKLQGILSADYDFNVLWFEGGGYYGLPSPGHTTLTRQGGPGSDFAVESSFHYAYRIQFDGRQESEWLEGYRGITLVLEAGYVLCEEGAALAVPERGSSLMAVSANPFSRSTDVVLGAVDGPVSLLVFDSRGRLVRSLIQGQAGNAGRRVVWDGRDDGGRVLPGGVYFLSLRARGSAESRRVIRVP